MSAIEKREMVARRYLRQMSGFQKAILLHSTQVLVCACHTQGYLHALKDIKEDMEALET